jgi:hypothetical protein
VELKVEVKEKEELDVDRVRMKLDDAPAAPSNYIVLFRYNTMYTIRSSINYMVVTYLSKKKGNLDCLAWWHLARCSLNGRKELA